jgi:hypothetical protein
MTICFNSRYSQWISNIFNIRGSWSNLNLVRTDRTQHVATLQRLVTAN